MTDHAFLFRSARAALAALAALTNAGCDKTAKVGPDTPSSSKDSHPE